MSCNEKSYLSGVGYVNCGRCSGCRKQKSMEWTYRLMCQLSSTPSSLFLTLTYSDDYYNTATLESIDFKRYMYRLRKAMPGRNIKYFTCGEYGDLTHRKHFHSIMYNVNWNDVKILKDNWYFGNIDIAPVEAGSLAYVTGYVNKKIYGDDKREWEEQGWKAPFHMISQNLGVDFVLKNYDLLKQRKYGLGINGQKYPLCRYFRNRLNLTLFDTEYSDYLENVKVDTVNSEFEKYKHIPSSIDINDGYYISIEKKEQHLQETKNYASECQLKTKNRLYKRSSI